MHKFLFVMLALAFGLTSCNKNQSKGDENSTAESQQIAAAQHDLKLYELHKSRGDAASAVYALTSLIMRDSTYTSFMDTLALLYYREGNAEACAAVVDEITDRRPDDKAMLELGGVAHQAAGNLPSSAEYFGQLYRVTGDIKYYYQVATILLNMGEFDETIKYTDEIIANKESKGVKVEMPGARGQLIKTSLLAASYALRGFAYGSKGKKDEAVASFRKSLELDPNFEPAAEGINDLLYRKKR